MEHQLLQPFAGPSNALRMRQNGSPASFARFSPAFQLVKYPRKSMVYQASALDDKALGLTSIDEDYFTTVIPEASKFLGPSTELRELATLQLSLLISTLESRLGDQTIEETAVRCAAYCRNPASLPTGQLQLQLVAATDSREAEAAQHRQDLILGLPAADDSPHQEAWLVEQNVIVLPESGGLVLPLAHNSFLVGLLVVECCAQGAFDGASHATHMVPPACSVFGPGDLVVIRQTGTALALACAMDLRAALERAGNALQRKHVQGLVRRVGQPLKTLRGLSAILTPRLREGEPERDLGEGIAAQGERLGDLIGQLQTALAPQLGFTQIAAPAAGAFEVLKNQKDQISWSPPPKQRFTTNTQGNGAEEGAVSYPALPSSSIGADNANFSNFSVPPRQDSVPLPSTGPPAHSGLSEIGKETGFVGVNLGGMLLPMLASASCFAEVTGVTFLPRFQNEDKDALHNVYVGVEPLALKGMLSRLLDGTMACAGRADCVEVHAELHEWQGQRGVMVSSRLLQAIGPGAGPNQGLALNGDGDVYLTEFASLARLARFHGGWFDVTIDSPTMAVHQALKTHSSSVGGSLLAALWLPLTE